MEVLEQIRLLKEALLARVKADEKYILMYCSYIKSSKTNLDLYEDWVIVRADVAINGNAFTVTLKRKMHYTNKTVNFNLPAWLLTSGAWIDRIIIEVDERKRKREQESAAWQTQREKEEYERLKKIYG